MKQKSAKIPFLYRIFKCYLRFLHDKIYYRKTYKINAENIPSNTTPTIIVSNHQNCLNDPLGVLFTFRDRKPNFITRADVFALHPIYHHISFYTFYHKSPSFSRVLIKSQVQNQNKYSRKGAMVNDGCFLPKNTKSP